MPTLHLGGRFGNQLSQYARARALCELSHCTLYTTPWLGQQVFDLNDPPGDLSAPNDFPGFAQRQVDLVYTRTQVRQWFKWKPEVAAKLAKIVVPEYPHAHLRRGDYLVNGYVIVSEASYRHALESRGFPSPPIWVSEESPLLLGGLPTWLPDFYRLSMAPTLLRANSTFSWWAHVLGRDDQVVFSPDIDHKPPADPSFCYFLPGNHPRMTQCCTCTDLILAP